MPLPSIVLAISKIVNEENLVQVGDFVEKLIVLGEQLESAVESGLKTQSSSSSTNPQ
jgi:hypothetical protein